MRLEDFGMPDEVLAVAKKLGVSVKTLLSFERSILTGTQSGYAFAFVFLFKKGDEVYDLVVLPDGKVKLYEPSGGPIAINFILGDSDDE